MTLKESGPEGRIDLDDICAAFTFSATAVRRTPSGERPITWASLSREVVDLVAEAEAGVGVKVDVAFVTDPEAALAMLIWRVEGPMELAVGLLAEVRALLMPFYRLSDTRSAPTEMPAVSALAVRPSATLPGSGAAGFTVIPGPRGRNVLSQGTDSGPDDLVAAMLAEPSLRYRITLASSPAGTDALTEYARLIQERPDVATDTFATLRALGRPVLCRAALEMTSSRPVPLRARAAVRSWFDGVDISPEANEFEVTTASLAASLLRLPTFDDQSWHGFAAETSRAVPVTISGFSRVETQAIRVGTAQDALGQTRSVFLGPEDLLRHIHVLGQTGTGKSTLLAAIARDASLNGYGLLVLDPHGSLIERIVTELPESAIERTWLLQPGDAANPIRLNPLAVSGEPQVAAAVQDLSEIFYALFDPKRTGIVGPRFEQLLRLTLRSLYELRGSRASLGDVPRILADRRNELALGELMDDPDLAEFWLKIQGQLADYHRTELVAWFTSKFDAFMGTPQMRSLLETGADSFDPAAAMDAGRIVLLDLDRSRLGLVGSRMTGLLYLTHFWTAAFERRNRKPFLILVDEAHTFTATALPAIAAEGRKFGLGLVVAHQHPDQLEEALLDALDGNAGTTIALRSGREGAQSLAHRLGPEFDVDDLAGLPDLVAAMVSARHARHTQPFTLTIDHNDREELAGIDLGGRRSRLYQQTLIDLVEPHRESERFSMEALRTAAAPLIWQRLNQEMAAEPSPASP